MGPKKSGGGAKAGDEEDVSTKNLLNIYKKTCKELEIPHSKQIENKILAQLEEDLHLPELLITDKIGEMGAKAIATALKKTKYFF
jgi:hypothetical protein